MQAYIENGHIGENSIIHVICWLDEYLNEVSTYIYFFVFIYM
jgi:hypothetical protein